MSQNTLKIYSIIPMVMAEIGPVAKSRVNTSQKYKFRGIEDFYEAIQPALIKYGLFCCPQVVGSEKKEFKKIRDGNETIWTHVFLRISHKFFADDGSFIDVITEGEGIDSSDKATNKAHSAAMKYAFIELFAIPTNDIEDSDRSSPEISGNRNAKPPSQPINKAMLNDFLNELPSINAPECCGRPMMKDKFTPNAFYCIKCKSKINKEMSNELRP